MSYWRQLCAMCSPRVNLFSYLLSEKNLGICISALYLFFKTDKQSFRDLLNIGKYFRTLDDMVDNHMFENNDISSIEEKLIENKRLLTSLFRNNVSKNIAENNPLYLRFKDFPKRYGDKFLGYIIAGLESHLYNCRLMKNSEVLSEADLRTRNLAVIIPYYQIIRSILFDADKKISITPEMEDYFLSLVEFNNLYGIEEDIKAGLYLFSKEISERYNWDLENIFDSERKRLLDNFDLTRKIGLEIEFVGVGSGTRKLLLFLHKQSLEYMRFPSKIKSDLNLNRKFLRSPEDPAS